MRGSATSWTSLSLSLFLGYVALDGVAVIDQVYMLELTSR